MGRRIFCWRLCIPTSDFFPIFGHIIIKLLLSFNTFLFYIYWAQWIFESASDKQQRPTSASQRLPPVVVIVCPASKTHLNKSQVVWRHMYFLHGENGHKKMRIDVQTSYCAAWNSHFQEVRWTVPDHVLEGLHIKTKVLHKNTEKKPQGHFFCFYDKATSVINASLKRGF